MKNLTLNKLQALAQAQQLSHAWLLEGANLANNFLIAQQFTQTLLCTNQPATQACGNCKACHLFAANTHPDYLLLKPEDGSSNITVDLIRTVNEFVIVPPQFAARKVVIIYPATAMNRQACNALLKSLEEPNVKVTFLLLVSNHKLLPITIASRCQRINLQDSAQALEVEQDKLLAMTDDLLKLLVDQSSTTVEIVEKLVKEDFEQVLYGLELFVADLLLYRYTQDVSMLRYLDITRASVGQKIAIERLLGLGERVRQAQVGLVMQHRLNTQLLLESILL